MDDNQQPQDQPNQPDPSVNEAPTDTSEEDEWTGATADYLIEKNGEQPAKDTEGKDDEPAKPEEGEEEKPAAQKDPADKKPDEEQKPGDDTEAKTGEDQPTETQPLTRAEIEADRKQTQEEIRKELFSDVPERLEDADGEPIETVEDVQKLMNPNTGQAFTESEAAAWLLAAQKHLSQRRSEADKRVEEIAEVHLSLKEQADNIRKKYGALLEANPNNIRQKIHDAYQKTLVVDKDKDFITDAPLSMEDFYDNALEPYEKMAEQMENQETQKAETEAKAKQQQQTKTKTQTRSDREDIIGNSTGSTKDPEEAEWEQAAKTYYET